MLAYCPSGLAAACNAVPRAGQGRQQRLTCAHNSCGGIHRALQAADVIVTTPEKWDGISRNWQNRGYVQKVRLP